jgi:uncharacterized OB-fold protein
VAPIVKRIFPIDPTDIMPAVTPDNAPYWDGFARGVLMLQTCSECNRARHPVAPICPYCKSAKATWVETSGSGSVFSFVRLHRSYLPEFEDLMPLVILTVELLEGPRMFGRLRGEKLEPRIGDPVRMVVEDWGSGRYVPAFELVGGDQEKGVRS